MTDALLSGTQTELTTEDAAVDVDEDHAAEPSVRVVEAVADRTDADPTTMAPLYDAIDPDALDALVDSLGEGYLGFEFAGCRVTVHADATVHVEEGR